jgi:hypothetical protein
LKQASDKNRFAVPAALADKLRMIAAKDTERTGLHLAWQEVAQRAICRLLAEYDEQGIKLKGHRG